MRSDPRVELVHHFFAGTGDTYDQMVNLWTIGFDLWWKKRILEKIPRTADGIIDQACGTGILTLKMAQKFPQAQVIGVELREEYVRFAEEKTRRLKLKNVSFILGRAEEILLNREFDCITSSYLAKYADIECLIANARKMLLTGGLLLMHDFTYPTNRLIAKIWELYFILAMQKIGSLVFPKWTMIFYELPGLVRKTKWVHKVIKSLRENHFSEITVESLTLGTSTIITAKKE